MNIDLFDLPGNVKIELRGDFRKKIFRFAQDKSKTLLNLSKILNIDYYTLLNFKHGRNFLPLEFLKGFAEYLEIDIDLFRKNYIAIHTKRGGKIKLNFPITIDKDFCWIIGFIIADGHISKSLSGLIISNNDETLIKLSEDIIRNTFMDCKRFMKVSRNKIRPKNILLEINSMILATIFSLFIKNGQKFDVAEAPKFIFNSDKEMICYFLRGIFDGDGYVKFNRKKYSRCIGIRVSSHKLIDDITKLLNILNIKSLKYDIKDRHEFCLQISDYQNIKKFYELVNFNQKNRRKLLNDVLLSYKQIQKPDGMSEKIALEIVKNIEPCTALEFINEYKCSRIRGQIILQKLYKNKLISRERIGRRTYLYRYLNNPPIPPRPSNFSPLI